MFSKSKFLKQVSTKMYMNKSSLERTTIIGTCWRFIFGHCNPLLPFAVDTGLGELNSLGFGFMNVLDREGRVVN
jgi:CRISPR/Cas system endoribonuclease Cas6 (RAMP superfamily)